MLMDLVLKIASLNQNDFKEAIQFFNIKQAKNYRIILCRYDRTHVFKAFYLNDKKILRGLFFTI